ncbi:hypothetical protein IAR50_002840 [Cryptococcus sp. DSM 104548]
MPLPTTAFSNDPATASSSRASSLAGRKRPRESDGDSKTRSRRTKSTGDNKDGRATSSGAKDREAFQKGLIAVFVPKALQESKQGNLSHYNDLLAHFLPTPTQPIPLLPPLLPLLRAVSAHVSLLAPDVHGGLVSAIISLPWATGDEKFVKTFIGFAAVLVSAQPGWAKEVVGMAVKGLIWQPTHPTTSSLPRRTFHARHHLLLSHLISLIPTLPSVIQPLLIKNFPNKREPEVAQTTWVRNCCELIGYCPELGGRVWGEIVGRMLRIDVEITNSTEDDEDDSDDESDSDDMPQFPKAALDPLDLPISQDIPRPRSLSPDLPGSIGVDDEDSEGDPDPDDLSSADGAESGDSDDEGVDERKAEAERQKKIANVKAMREKLDGMLVYFFQHISEYMGNSYPHFSAVDLAAQGLASSTSSGRSTPTFEVPASPFAPRRPVSEAQSLAHFQTLLNLFSRQILPTSATQHIPFLLFFTSSFSPAHTDLFLGLLVSQALYATNSQPSPAIAGLGNVSMNQRTAATVYIGSIVCRARFVSDAQARTVLTYLLAYIDGKLHQSRVLAGKGVDELPLFYAVCQAVMLIFCFRWKAFTATAAAGDNEGDGIVGDMDMDGEEGLQPNSGEEGKWMADLDVLQRAIFSDLNPLLGCNPTIVQTFAKVAQKAQFAYCFSILGANNQSSHSRSNSSHSISTAAKTNMPSNGRSSSGSGMARQSAASVSGHAAQTLPRQARQVNVEAGLDSYFPFDPYDLPKSKKFVEGLYRTWGEVAEDLDSDSEDESDEEEEDDEDEEEDTNADSELEDHLPHRGLPLPLKIGSYGDHRKRAWGEKGRDSGLSTSLEGMSISPGRLGVGARG